MRGPREGFGCTGGGASPNGATDVIRDTAAVAPAHRDSGQALVELAIVVPILALILFGAVQFALIFERQIGINNALREAARRGAALVTDDANVTQNASGVVDWLIGDGTDPGLLATNVQGYNSSNLLSILVCYTPVSDDPSGDPQVEISTTVAYGHPLFLPIISGILDGIDGTTDNLFRVDSASTFRVENSNEDVLSAGACSP